MDEHEAGLRRERDASSSFTNYRILLILVKAIMSLSLTLRPPWTSVLIKCRMGLPDNHA